MHNFNFPQFWTLQAQFINFTFEIVILVHLGDNVDFCNFMEHCMYSQQNISFSPAIQETKLSSFHWLEKYAFPQVEISALPVCFRAIFIFTVQIRLYLPEMKIRSLFKKKVNLMRIFHSIRVPKDLAFSLIYQAKFSLGSFSYQIAKALQGKGAIPIHSVLTQSSPDSQIHPIMKRATQVAVSHEYLF